MRARWPAQCHLASGSPRARFSECVSVGRAIVDASGAKTIRIMCQPPCGSGNLPLERNRAILAIFHVLTFAVGPFGAPLARVCTRHLSCSHLQCALFFFGSFVCFPFLPFILSNDCAYHTSFGPVDINIRRYKENMARRIPRRRRRRCRPCQ